MKKTSLIMALMGLLFHTTAWSDDVELFTVSQAKTCMDLLQAQKISTHEIEVVLAQRASSLDEVIFPSVETRALAQKEQGQNCWSYLIEMNHIAEKEFNVDSAMLMDMIQQDTQAEKDSPVQAFQSVSWLQDQIRALYPVTPSPTSYALAR
jgi:hypothetical protein